MVVTLLLDTVVFHRVVGLKPPAYGWVAAPIDWSKILSKLSNSAGRECWWCCRPGASQSHRVIGLKPSA